jgi:sterol desaturase/sphingolipid hydroxylase (fatty acid hydroxylase superfamily)
MSSILKVYCNISHVDYITYGMIPLLFNTSVFWMMCIVFAFMDYYCDSNGLLKKYKIQGKQIVKSGGINWKKYYDTGIAVIINQIIINLPVSIFMIPILKNMVNNKMCWYVLPFQIVMVLSIEEILFYSVHRLLHVPKLYKRIHKTHHQWVAPVAIAAQYAHPLEQLLSNYLPIMISGYLAGLNWICMNIWITMATVNSACVHSDYKIFSFGKSHNEHHRYFNCNYGTIGFMDSIFKTKSNDVVLKIDSNMRD